MDPAELGANLQPGDKISMTFHKAQPKPGAGGSFMDNAQRAGMVPGGQPAVAPAPMGMSPAPDSRMLLAAALRRRMGLV